MLSTGAIPRSDAGPYVAYLALGLGRKRGFGMHVGGWVGLDIHYYWCVTVTIGNLVHSVQVTQEDAPFLISHLLRGFHRWPSFKTRA